MNQPTSGTISRRALLSLAAAAGAASLSGCALLPDRLDLARADLRRDPPDPRVALGVTGGLLGFTERWLATATGDTLACSPLSVWVALAMIRIGARGETAAAMDRALGFPTGRALDQGVNTLLQQLATRSGKRGDEERKGTITLNIADQVFGQTGLTWNPEFLATLARSYGTGVARSDFATDPEKERKRINGWVADHTDHKIPELLAPGLITTDTRLVLANALRLVAPWAEKFATRPGEFTGDNGRKHVEMLYRPFIGTAGRGRDWVAAEAPYLGGELAMTIVLPAQGVDVAARLRGGLLREVFAELAPEAAIELTLPAFETRSSLALRPLLTALGMGVAFTDGADFSGLTDDAPLEIDAVQHEGWISVDAEGTEAAAATAVVAVESSAQRVDNRVVVTCDRPFLYVVHDIATGAPLMAGRVGDPGAAAKVG